MGFQSYLRKNDGFCGAAIRLGMKRSTLTSRMAKLGIVR